MDLQSIKNRFDTWDWMLFATIIFYMIVPQIYRSYSIFLIGNRIPSPDSLAIVSQWQFVQVTLEILQEASILPIFYFVGKSIKKSSKKISNNIKISYFFIFIIYIIFIIILQLNLNEFINFIGTADQIYFMTKQYLRIKLIGVLFSVLSLGSIVIIKSLNKKKILVSITLVKLVLSIGFDSLFYGGYSFSLGWGIIGVAWSNLIVDLLIFIISIIWVLNSLGINIGFIFEENLYRDIKDRIRNFILKKDIWIKKLKEISRVGLGSGIDSAVRNIAYILLIIKMVNLLGPDQIGGYYLAMHIFWGFALIPILASTETTRVLIANNHKRKKLIKNTLFSSLSITGVVVIIWIFLLTPFWKDIAYFFNKNAQVVSYSYKAFVYLFIPYILLAFNTVVDSLFYGVGKTRYMAYQSIITNGTVYVGAYLLYIFNIWNPTFFSIMLLFGAGLIVDMILTIYYARVVLSKI